jgi:assimilatory nitrate reductase catalytic subunit
VDFAQRLESVLRPAQPSLFPYSTAESVWNEHRESTRGRDLDITGMDYAMLDAAPRQWPLPEGATQGKVRLYEDGIFPTPDGKARFANVQYRPVAEPLDARYPFALTTGRLRDQWHGMSRTGTLGRLFGHAREPALQMHPQDMMRRLLKEGDLVHITSRRGSIVAPVQAAPELGLSQVFMAMHWGEEYLSGASSTGLALAGVNALTTGAFCPDSKQPEFKHAAVKVLKADMPWSLLAMAWLPAENALSVLAEVRALMPHFAFASCVPFSRKQGESERTGVQFRASHHDPIAAEVLQKLEHLLQLDNPLALHYVDRKRGQRRVAVLHHGDTASTLEGFMLAGDTSAQAWISTLLQDAQPANPYGGALLLTGAKPPVPVVDQGKPVCLCFGVTDKTINAELARCKGSEPERLTILQDKLKCGTHCGSCVPQLQRMVKASLGATVQPA